MATASNETQRHPQADRIEQAAFVYFTEHDKTLEQIAQGFAIDRVTFWRWRQTPEWAQAIERVKVHARSVAYKRLIFSAGSEEGSPGVTAARSLLDRTEGPVVQKTELSGGLDLSLIGNLKPSTRQAIIRDLESEESGEDLADAEGS